MGEAHRGGSHTETPHPPPQAHELRIAHAQHPALAGGVGALEGRGGEVPATCSSRAAHAGTTHAGRSTDSGDQVAIRAPADP